MALADEDALDGWRQAHILHLRAHTLNKELKAVEGALAREENEADVERLVQIQNEIAKAETADALIEGFGVPSGRPAQTF